MSLSKTVKGLQRQLGGSIQLAAKDNPVLGPQVQRLVTGYEAWENKLRSEAQSRLINGFAPPDPGLHVRNPMTLLSDGDWDLLKRVPKSLPSSSMKKSASADSLDSMTGTMTTTGPSTSAGRGGSRLGGGLGGRGHSPYGMDSHSHHDGASYSGSGSSGYGSGLHGEASIYGPRLVPMRGLQTPAGVGGASYQPSEQMLLRLGIPRVPTAPSLQELSDTLNLEAAKNIEAFLDTSLKASGRTD